MRSTAVPLALMLALCVAATAQSSNAQTAHRMQLKTPPRIVHGTPITAAAESVADTSQLPVWVYNVVSSRDGNAYKGVMVGNAPTTSGSGASASVPTQIVPVVLNFQTVATAYNSSTGTFSTAPGNETSSPLVPDTGCFTGTDNVPVNLLTESPMFQSADFNFGGTDVGTTQYTDAFQRANFWSQIDQSNYHVLLSPVQVLQPLVITVPPKEGISLPTDIFAPSFSLCGREGIADVFVIDTLVLKALSKTPGITPGTFPMFMLYNTVMSVGDPTNLANCCIGGYHSINALSATSIQTYSPFDFDVSGFLISSGNDTAIVSHEAAEWMDDPYLINATPPWGNTGQVIGCQANLEDGDPLTGLDIQRIFMPNGYTYHLQELAFFDWFFGAPSRSIHGWYSDNATFLTDAGPPCS